MGAILFFGFAAVMEEVAGEDGCAKSIDVRGLTIRGVGADDGITGATTGAGAVDPGSALTNVGWILRFLGVGCSLAILMTESPSRSVLNDVLGDSAGETEAGDCVAVVVADAAFAAATESPAVAGVDSVDCVFPGCFLEALFFVVPADSPFSCFAFALGSLGSLDSFFSLAFCSFFSVSDSPFSFCNIPAVAAILAAASNDSLRSVDVLSGAESKSIMDLGGIYTVPSSPSSNEIIEQNPSEEVKIRLHPSLDHAMSVNVA